MGAFDSLSDDDPIVIKHERRKRMNTTLPHCPAHGYYSGNCDKCDKHDVRTIFGTHEQLTRPPVQQLLAENAKLRAELEALKPKPVVTTTELMFVDEVAMHYSEVKVRDWKPQLLVTFHDGVLHSAEVING